MKTNQGVIILTHRAADYGRLRAVLCEWGYRESEIQHFLRERRVHQKLDKATYEKSGEAGEVVVPRDRPNLLTTPALSSCLK